MVFAALPLKPPFTLLAGKFQTDNPGATVDFDFATSAELANKLAQGAKADVFASADSAQMDTVVKADLASSDPVNFASNTLVIVTAPGDPKQIRSFADLARPDVRVAVCQASAPCGAGVQHIEDDTGVHFNPVSEESIGAAVLAKVTDGAADAGLVYMNDAHKAGDKVGTVRFPESADAVNIYPIVALKKAVAVSAGAEIRRPGHRCDGPTGAESGRLRQPLKVTRPAALALANRHQAGPRRTAEPMICKFAPAAPAVRGRKSGHNVGYSHLRHGCNTVDFCS